MKLFDQGAFDPLTGLMTPAYFYESLSRLRSWAKRSDSPVSLIALDLSGLSQDLLVKCARDLSAELRGGDLLARMGFNSFALALVGDELSARHLIFRLSNTIKEDLKYSATLIQRDESPEIALGRVGI